MKLFMAPLLSPAQPTGVITLVSAICCDQFYFRALFEKMSKGGAGGAAANVLLLKKNEDK